MLWMIVVTMQLLGEPDIATEYTHHAKHQTLQACEVAMEGDEFNADLAELLGDLLEINKIDEKTVFSVECKEGQ